MNINYIRVKMDKALKATLSKKYSAGINWKPEGSPDKKEIGILDLWALAIKYPEVFPKEWLDVVNKHKQSYIDLAYQKYKKELAEKLNGT